MALTETVPPFAVDLGGAVAAYPAWLRNVPAASEVTLGEADFEVTAPEAGRNDLLLTVFFDDADSGFIRIYRQDGATAEMVADNLNEGTGLPNQRTLLLRDVGTQAPTRIVFQSSGKTLPVRRLVWEWPRTQSLGVTAAAPGLAAIRGQAALTDAEVSGQPLPSPISRVGVAYTATPLLDQVVQVSDTLALAAAIEQLPRHARLVGKIAGLAPGQSLECWINGAKAGILALPLPSLLDPAYFFAPETTPTLAGWQEGTLYLPATAWLAGENRIELRVPEGAHALYAVKDLVLEFVYASAPSPTSIPANP